MKITLLLMRMTNIMMMVIMTKKLMTKTMMSQEVVRILTMAEMTDENHIKDKSDEVQK